MSTPNRSASEDALVLIVDDFRDGREMYAEFLRSAGFRVVEAENGQQALDLAFTLSPSIILMDLSLPVMDGLSAIRALHGDPRSASIPLVALSAHSRDDSVSAATRAGCAAFLEKPCSPEALLLAVRTLLSSRSRGTPAR